VSPTTIHADFKGGAGNDLSTIAAQALAGSPPCSSRRRTPTVTFMSRSSNPGGVACSTGRRQTRRSSTVVKSHPGSAAGRAIAPGSGPARRTCGDAPKNVSAGDRRHLRNDPDGVQPIRPGLSDGNLGADGEYDCVLTADRVSEFNRIPGGPSSPRSYRREQQSPSAEVAAEYADRLIGTLGVSRRLAAPEIRSTGPARSATSFSLDRIAVISAKSHDRATIRDNGSHLRPLPHQNGSRLRPFPHHGIAIVRRSRDNPSVQ
jgi:hypothetical protein